MYTDYVCEPCNVTFPTGETHVPFTISLNNDIAFEGNRESVLTINPSSLPASVTIGNPGQATIAIVHNDSKLFGYIC